MSSFDKLRELLHEQARRAFTKLVFPSQIESAGVTNGPHDWKQLPENYRKALNPGFGVSIDDST